MKGFKKSVLKNVLGTVLVIGAASSGSSVIFAADPIGSVSPITKISYNATASATSFDAGVEASVKIATGVIDSNVPAGFIITVGSDNKGGMKREGSLDSGAGSIVKYTHYELAKGPSGTLGTDASPFGKVIIPAVKLGSVNFRSGPVRSATVAQDYVLKVYFTPSNDLLSGSYTDTISLGISYGY